MVGIALWRLLDEDPNAAVQRGDADYLLRAGEMLLGSAVVTRLFGIPAVRTRVVLARFGEDIIRGLIALAWENGDVVRAKRLFETSMRFRTTAELNGVERKLLRHAGGAAEGARGILALSLGKRLLKLGRHYDAEGALELAMAGESEQVSVEAGLHLAKLWRIQGRSRGEILELMDSLVRELDGDVEDETAQAVLLERAIRYNREGRGRNVDLARRDLTALIHRYPRGKKTDTAMYELARSYEGEGGRGRGNRRVCAIESVQGPRWRKRLGRLGGFSAWLHVLCATRWTS